MLPAKVTDDGDTPRVGATPVQLSVMVRLVLGMPVDASSLVTVRTAVRVPAAVGEQRMP